MSANSVLTRRRVLSLVLGCALLAVAAAAPARGEDRQSAGVNDLITFTWSVSPEDPFSKQNAAGARPEFRRGETFFVTITGKPKEGFHTYPLTKKTQQQSGGMSKLTYESEGPFTPLWPVVESQPTFVDEGADFGINLEHEKPFTWTQEFLVRPDATPGPATLRLSVRLQVCDEDRCTPGTIPLEIPVVIAAGDAVPPTPALTERIKESPPAPQVVPVDEKTPVMKRPEKRAKPPEVVLEKGKADAPAPAPAGDEDPLTRAREWLSFLPEPVLFVALAAVAGLLSLFTPCVFPMIPITVSYFLKQSEAKQGAVVKTAGIYSATIIAVLTVGGILLMTSLKQISSDWRTNAVLGALFLVFALSLLGMFEITVPSWLVNFTSSKQERGGAVGTVFMALTFTLVSFTCVAPFFGGLGAAVAAAQSAADWAKIVSAALAYSVTFALPFFLLAIFPGLMRMLPRSGGWMNTVKVVMGFLELAAGVGFFRAAERGLTHNQAVFLTFDLVLGVYVALSIACGLYLLNLFRLPHDYDPPQTLSVPRLLFALAFITLGLYLAPGLVKQANGKPQEPHGAVFGWVRSFLQLDHVPQSASPAGPNQTRELVWLANLKEGLEKAKKERKRVFIDFTGVYCKNCSYNEDTVFPQPAIHDLLEQYVLVQLYTDVLPGYITNGTSAADNAALEKSRFRDEQLPLYVIVEPDGDDFKELEKYPEGKINSVSAFQAFLTRHLPGSK